MGETFIVSSESGVRHSVEERDGAVSCSCGGGCATLAGCLNWLASNGRCRSCGSYVAAGVPHHPRCASIAIPARFGDVNAVVSSKTASSPTLSDTPGERAAVNRFERIETDDSAAGAGEAEETPSSRFDKIEAD